MSQSLNQSSILEKAEGTAFDMCSVQHLGLGRVTKGPSLSEGDYRRVLRLGYLHQYERIWYMRSSCDNFRTHIGHFVESVSSREILAQFDVLA